MKNETNTLRNGKSTRNFLLWLSNDYNVYSAIVAYGRELARAGCSWDWQSAEWAAVTFFGDETPDGARAERVYWDQVAEVFAEWA